MTFSDDCRLSLDPTFSGEVLARALSNGDSIEVFSAGICVLLDSDIEGRFASIAPRTECFSGEFLVLLLDFSA